MVSGPVVTTDALTMAFGDNRALDRLEVSTGEEVTGLIRADGAGRATLFNILLGLMTPSSGSVTVAGLDPVRDGAAVRSCIGYSPERNVLPDDTQAYGFARHLAQVRGLLADDSVRLRLNSDSRTCRTSLHANGR